MAGENAALKEAARQSTQAGAAGAPQPDRTDHPSCGVTRIVDADDGRLAFYMPDGATERKKFALCGFASTTREMAPVTDPEWAVVTMNQLYRHMVRRGDAHFEIHADYLDAVVPGTDHEGWCRDCGIPVLMTARRPQLPTSVRFPIERLIARFDHDYFTSTVAHMAAFFIDHIDQRVEARMRAAPGNGLASAFDVAQLQRAIYAEYSLGFYGIDLVVGEEYTWQRPCAEFYLGQALARNIAVHIPKPSALLKQRYRYGYQMEPAGLILESDLERRRIGLVNAHQQHSEELLKLTGALGELAFWTELRSLREKGAEVG